MSWDLAYLAAGIVVGCVLMLMAGSVPYRLEIRRLRKHLAETKAHDDARVAAFQARLDKMVEEHRKELEAITQRMQGGRAPHG